MESSPRKKRGNNNRAWGILLLYQLWQISVNSRFIRLDLMGRGFLVASRTQGRVHPTVGLSVGKKRSVLL